MRGSSGGQSYSNNDSSGGQSYSNYGLSGGQSYSNYGSTSYSNTTYNRLGERIDIYTDGACPNNGFGGAKGGIGAHFPHNPKLDISEPLEGRQTNNRAEIKAATRALEVAKSNGHRSVRLKTDSEFLYKSVNQWKDIWKRNNWRKSDGTDVINKEDFIELEEASKGMDIEWEKVRAHVGIDGNERADRLANMGAQNNHNF